MSDFTPTTERVRQRWLEAYECERDMPGTIRKKYPDEVLSMFDRWLTEHDRQVAERAWDEGAKEQADAYGMDVDTGPNPYRSAS